MKGKDVGGTSLMTNEDHGGVDNIGGKISWWFAQVCKVA
jgi:hypothetical protein